MAASKALETALRQRICGARGLSKSRPAPARDIQHIDVLTLCVVPQLPTTSQGLMATEDISGYWCRLPVLRRLTEEVWPFFAAVQTMRQHNAALTQKTLLISDEMIDKIFDICDKDKNGYLNEDEYIYFLKGPNPVPSIYVALCTNACKSVLTRSSICVTGIKMWGQKPYTEDEFDDQWEIEVKELKGPKERASTSKGISRAGLQKLYTNHRLQQLLLEFNLVCNRPNLPCPLPPDLTVPCTAGCCTDTHSKRQGSFILRGW